MSNSRQHGQNPNLKNDKRTQEAYEKLVDKFHGDQRKASDYMHQPQRELGGKSPMTMIGEHRTDELNRHIDLTRKRYY